MDSKTLGWVGVGVLVVGLIWAGQGIGWIGGSFMTGQTTWLVIGLGLVALGGWLAYRSFGRRG